MEIQPVTRKNISEQAFNQMREMIVSGEWAPGTKIPSENKLAEEMGVSRVTIRSAIQKLSSMGLLKSIHGSGTYVCKAEEIQSFSPILPSIVLTGKDREDVHEFRTVIESACARLAAKRITPSQLEQLRNSTDQMEACRDNPEAAAAFDMSFHKGIALATQNTYLIQVFEILETIYMQNFEENMRIMGSTSGVHFHKKICDALELRDGDLAEKYMQDHLEVTNETVKRLLSEREQEIQEA